MGRKMTTKATEAVEGKELRFVAAGKQGLHPGWSDNTVYVIICY